MVTAYQALFIAGNPISVPGKVRFLIGMVPGHYHYTSPLFKFAHSAEEQYFSLLPDVVVGKYVKVEMYEKPQQSIIDGRFYIGLQKVSCNGFSMSNEEIPEPLRPTIKQLVANEYKNKLSDINAHPEEHKTDEPLPMTKEEFEKAEEGLIALAKHEINYHKY